MTARRRAGDIVEFRIRGHAAFAAAGQDIICAGVSALVLSAAYGLEHHCGVKPVIKDAGRDYVLSLPAAHDRRAQAVLETALSGLQAIARSYPGHLDVRVTAGIGARRSKS